MYEFKTTPAAYSWIKATAQGPVSVITRDDRHSAFVAAFVGNFWYMASVASFIKFFKL